MFPQLRKKLIFVYTASTGLILSLVLALAFCFYASSVSRQQEAAFQNHLITLSSRLQSDSSFSDSELARLELQDHLLISIEENGHPLFFSGAYGTPTSRSILTSRAESAAREEGINTSAAPVSSEMTVSPLLHIEGEQNDSYLASVLIARQEKGYKKLILLSDETGTRTGLFMAGLLYLLVDAGGILLLFLIGRRFVRHALLPAQEGFSRQQEFVAAASHELRSPLAVIRASASAIPGSPEHSGKLIRTILKECQRGSSLIKSLLLLASADSHTLSIQKTCFEIDELLLNLLELYEPLFHSRNGHLLLELPEEPLPCAYADPDLCRQILTILLDNAAAYGLRQDNAAAYDLQKDCSEELGSGSVSPQTPNAPAAGTAAGKIVLKAANSGNTIFLSVEDHGPGLSNTEKERIFDRFYRAEGSRSDKEHFGLGLSIASDLAKIQELPLSVSDTEGGGCTFTLRIPAESL